MEYIEKSRKVPAANLTCFTVYSILILNNIENDVKVKLIIWNKDNHLAHWKLTIDSHTLFPLEYIGSVNFVL